MSWYLQIANDPPLLFSDLGLSSPKRSIRSRQPGSFLFTADGANADSNPLAPEGALCTVFSDSTPFFSGRLHKIPRKGSGHAESVHYEILDAWRDFERNVYQQQWNVISPSDLAAEYRSECILGADINGNQLNSGQVITDIVNFAISLGAHCQLGSIQVAAPVPLDEVHDLPCSECITKMLHWTPDAVAWFDYALVPPAFNITPRFNCPAISFPFLSNIEEIEINPLPELVIPSVAIRYLQENRVNGSPAIAVIPDIYPTDATGLEFGALVSSMRLAGNSSSYQTQQVHCVTIPTNDSLDSSSGGGPSDDPTILWWQRKVPWLAQFSPSRLSITGISSTVDSSQFASSGGGSPPPDDGSSDSADTGADQGGTPQPADTSIGDYPNELTSGAIAPWMNYKVATTTWTASVAYNYPGTLDDEAISALPIFGPGSGGFSGNTSPTVQLQCKAKATNCPSGIFKGLTSYDAGEPVPIGLARQLYSSLNPLHYEGHLTVVNQDVFTSSLGFVLNILGGRLEWQSMQALIQEIQDDLEPGRTTYRFGPPSHLTLQDLMEQLRGSRLRIVTTHYKERQTGVPGDPPQSNGPNHTAVEGGSSPPTSLPTWFAYDNDQPGDAGDSPTWDVLLGYGQASFSGSGGIDHADPIESFELSVGQDGSGWSGSEYDSTSVNNALSIQSGNDSPEDDLLLIATNNGSILLTPNDPSIYLSPNIDPLDDDSDTQHINIDLASMLIELQDDDGSYIQINLSDDPAINILNAATNSSSALNENTLFLDDVPSGGAVTIDASTTSGKAISWQTIKVCVSGSWQQMLVLGSAPFT